MAKLFGYVLTGLFIAYVCATCGAVPMSDLMIEKGKTDNDKNVILVCKWQNNELEGYPTIFWGFENKTITTNNTYSDKYMIEEKPFTDSSLPSSKLTIRDIKRTDQGVYTCYTHPTEDHLTPPHHHFTLILDFSPSLLIEPHDDVHMGDGIAIHCVGNVRKMPGLEYVSPSGNWSNAVQYRQLFNMTMFEKPEENRTGTYLTMRIPNVNINQSGMYRCSKGMLEDHKELTVKGVVFNCKGPTTPVKLWGNAFFDCNITRYPQLQLTDVHWYKYKAGVIGHTRITDNDKYKTTFKTLSDGITVQVGLEVMGVIILDNGFNFKVSLTVEPTNIYSNIMVLHTEPETCNPLCKDNFMCNTSLMRCVCKTGRNCDEPETCNPSCKDNFMCNTMLMKCVCKTGRNCDEQTTPVIIVPSPYPEFEDIHNEDTNDNSVKGNVNNIPTGLDESSADAEENWDSQETDKNNGMGGREDWKNPPVVVVTHTSVATIVGSTMGALAVILLVLVSFICYKRHKKSTALKTDNPYRDPSMLYQYEYHSEANVLKENPTFSNPGYQTAPPKPTLRKENTYVSTLEKDGLEFPRERLQLGVDLGEGRFGKVIQARAMNIRGTGNWEKVAVKTCRGTATDFEKQDLYQELEIMRKLPNHQNIVQLFGCCSKTDPLYIIMEYVQRGSLLSYLRKCRPSSRMSRDSGLSSNMSSSSSFMEPRAKDLSIFALQIARGMAQVASIGIIHRDLAVRNVLLATDFTCKICDFGLARDVEGVDVYERTSKGPLPIRWMAPEALEDNLYTRKSDVWSYGVLLWEVVTLGATPYPGKSAMEVMRQVLHGQHLQRPLHCKEEMYELMVLCWEKMDDRPSFADIVTHHEALMDDDYIVLDDYEEDDYGWLESYTMDERV